MYWERNYVISVLSDQVKFTEIVDYSSKQIILEMVTCHFPETLYQFYQWGMEKLKKNYWKDK